MGVDVFADTGALNFLELVNELEVNAVGINDVAVGVGHGDNLGAVFGSLFGSVDGNVAGTGNDNGLILEALALSLKSLVHEVAETVAGSLGTGQRAAPFKSLAGKNAGVFVAETLVLAIEEADFTAAHTDIAGRNVGISADMLAELGHEALAESHDFTIALALGVKIGTALAAADGESGKAVLENLFEAEELDD